MRLKSELYSKEQTDIINKIINILELENNQITLYNLDTNIQKQQKLMELIPEIRKYFSFRNIRGVAEPSEIKRPWLSMIRQLLKSKYNIKFQDHRIYFENPKRVVRTIIYTFEEIV